MLAFSLRQWVPFFFLLSSMSTLEIRSVSPICFAKYFFLHSEFINCSFFKSVSLRCGELQQQFTLLIPKTTTYPHSISSTLFSMNSIPSSSFIFHLFPRWVPIKAITNICMEKHKVKRFQKIVGNKFFRPEGSKELLSHSQQCCLVSKP
jgi:hypothetical protein